MIQENEGHPKAEEVYPVIHVNYQTIELGSTAPKRARQLKDGVPSFVTADASHLHNTRRHDVKSLPTNAAKRYARKLSEEELHTQQ